MIKEGFSW